MINKEENKVTMDDLKNKMARAKRAAKEYQDIDVDRDEGNEMLDVADLIVENKLLLE